MSEAPMGVEGGASGPPTVHLMYFPWDRNQQWIRPPDRFDRAPFEAMVEYARPLPVRLWSFDEAEAFCRREYPEIAEALRQAKRPVMWVDVLRWVVVHHFGGIYIQYNTTPLVPMPNLLPGTGKQVRLFTEFQLTPKQCRAAADQPIRKGAPEESARILIQAFSAHKGAGFIRRLLGLLTERLLQHSPRRDYDILFITGNAAASTAYERFGRHDPTVERVGLADSRRMLKWVYTGSWRTETAAPKSLPVPEAMFRQAVVRRRPLLDPLRGIWFRMIRTHVYESVLFARGDPARRSHLTPELVRHLSELGVRSVVEIPCGRVDPRQVEELDVYCGGDLGREFVRMNRTTFARGKASFRKLNPLYDVLPPADLVLCGDFLEWLPFRDAARVLRTLLHGRARYLCLSSHPLLLYNWDAALGDARPLNFQAKPFCFPGALQTVPAAKAGERMDRCLAIWSTADARVALTVIPPPSESETSTS